MSELSLRADCQQCADLCCVAFAFDKRQGFAIDKSNGEPCPHLCASKGCGIYEARAQSGFGNCIGFDCQGAGQRVTQDLFGGQHWRDNQQKLPAMVEAFLSMLVVHELISLLKAASAMPLSRKDQWMLDVLCEQLSPEGGWTEVRLSVFRDGRLERCVRKYLTTLKRYYRQAPPLPVAGAGR